MIKPLVIANKTFPVNLIQGPLAGVSCAPFRELTWRYSKPAFSCTEMISCKTLLNKALYAQHRYVTKDPDEGPVCFQLSGNDPTELAEATKIATEQGADLIDLNCGCPKKKIRTKGTGSSLLKEPETIFKLITAMKNSTHVPVSIKIRVDGKSSDRFNKDIVKAVTDAGADFLIVHGRHWTESYDTPCHYDQIQFFVENLTIPVIGNGDITCAESLKKMLNTGCAGIMISRAGVGQPWLIAKLIADLKQQEFSLPSNLEIGSIFFEHVQKLALLLNNEKFALLQARKFAKYYARTLTQKNEFCLKMNECEDLQKLQEICANYFV